jgi:hypothetical protein
MNISLKDQLSAIENQKYPFVRRDGTVRAIVLNENDEAGTVMIATAVVGQKVRPPRYGADVPRAYNMPVEATIRNVSKDYFENNYWEGSN